MRRRKETPFQEDIMEIIYKAKRNIVPPEGGWVHFKGNPLAPRGFRVDGGLRDVGVRHMDIYFAYNEHCPWGAVKEALGYRPYAAGDICDFIEETNWLRPGLQLTKVDLVTPVPTRVCAWSGEVAKTDEETIQMLLGEGWIETIEFASRSKNPVWDELTRDMIGSLMLDGLNMYQAQNELIRAGEQFERKVILPAYFYRPIGLYRDMFCEEE